MPNTVHKTGARLHTVFGSVATARYIFSVSPDLSYICHTRSLLFYGALHNIFVPTIADNPDRHTVVSAFSASHHPNPLSYILSILTVPQTETIILYILLQITIYILTNFNTHPFKQITTQILTHSYLFMSLLTYR